MFCVCATPCKHLMELARLQCCPGCNAACPDGASMASSGQGSLDLSTTLQQQQPCITCMHVLLLMIAHLHALYLACSAHWGRAPLSLLSTHFLTGGPMPLLTAEFMRCRYVYNHSTCGRCGSQIATWDMASRTVYACETCQPLTEGTVLPSQRELALSAARPTKVSVW